MNVLNAEEVKELTSAAENFGLSADFIAECLNKYGPEVLSVAIEGIKNGFSVGFVIELVRLFGPVVLDFILSLFKTSNKSFSMAEQKGMAPSDATLADFLNDKDAQNFAPILMKLMVEKIIPYVIKNYGDQIVKALLDALQNAFNEKESARFANLIQNVKA
jgi:hypothetical protein